MRPVLPRPPTDTRLPDGLLVVLDASTRRLDGGRALLGGAPLRLLTLSPRARALLPGDRLVVRDATTATLARRLTDAGLAHPQPGSVAADDVTVVVPVRDRPDGLRRLLAAVRRTAGDLPILVVDDGSRDPATVRAVADRHSARVLRHERPRGPAAARNTGLRAADTEYVALLDSDCVPPPGWLDRLRPHLTDPLVAAVAPRIGSASPGRGWLAAYETVASSLDLGGRAAVVAPHGRVPYVPSAALLVRRWAVVSGYDEDMQVAEDVDLVWRLAAAGWRVRYEPAATVAHEHRTRPGAWALRRAFYGTGATALADRHGDAVAPLVVSPWSLVAWLGLLTPAPLGRLLGLAALGVSMLRLRRQLTGLDRPGVLAGRLVGVGTLASGRQLASAVTRHYWPVTALLALRLRRVRRVALAAALVDGVLAWWPHRDRMAVLPFIAARRLDDLSYGAGLWWGALRARSPRALRPRLRSTPNRARVT